MDGFQRRREQKKLKILEAGLALFMKYGVQKISIAEIAKKANVSQVTIYNYFESKHNLIHEVFFFYLNIKGNEFKQLIHSRIPFPEKIKQFMFTNLEESKQVHEDFYKYVIEEYTSPDSKISKTYLDDGIALYIELFNQGKEEGFIDPHLSNEAIIFFLQATNQYMRQEEVFNKILPFSEDILKILFYGIMGKGKE